MPQPEPTAPVDPPVDNTFLSQAERSPHRWYHKASAIMGAILCFELGMVLIIYPWLSDWSVHAALLPAGLRPLWNSAWFRGAVTGLGILDVYISILEAVRLRRFSG